MTTTCTICGMPTPGRDDDDDAYCLWCFTQHVGWSEQRPLGLWRWPEPQRPRRALPIFVRAWSPERGREETL